MGMIYYCGGHLSDHSIYKDNYDPIVCCGGSAY